MACIGRQQLSVITKWLIADNFKKQLNDAPGCRPNHSRRSSYTLLRGDIRGQRRIFHRSDACTTPPHVPHSTSAGLCVKARYDLVRLTRHRSTDPTHSQPRAGLSRGTRLTSAHGRPPSDRALSAPQPPAARGGFATARAAPREPGRLPSAAARAPTTPLTAPLRPKSRRAALLAIPVRATVDVRTSPVHVCSGGNGGQVRKARRSSAIHGGRSRTFPVGRRARGSLRALPCACISVPQCHEALPGGEA
ncbi:uncharacterized protein LOC122152899 [Tyto alba]|uniref:uncharacterized protein LOC122152899 n=1 Tax=Tyto alba TaxID=56313 RepID=UPI001C6776FA|nr:uncharacterized protein LOC122152899 [Tyto alba]